MGFRMFLRKQRLKLFLNDKLSICEKKCKDNKYLIIEYTSGLGLKIKTNRGKTLVEVEKAEIDHVNYLKDHFLKHGHVVKIK